MGKEERAFTGKEERAFKGKEEKRFTGKGVKEVETNKNIFNSIKGGMYREIDDYETNKVLLETEIETDYKSKNKSKNTVIDSKTILFTENTNISSEIEDNDIYTFS